MQKPKTKHPPHLRARLARQFRWLRNIRGWGSIANAITPYDGDFVVPTQAGWFAGNLSSFIDRQIYLYGGYEGDLIDCFLKAIPASRRGTILDIGANVGTHSLVFARHFRQVHAFEPNPRLWPSFERNLEVNAIGNVHLHKVGLGQKDEDLTLYLVDEHNFGLGTLSEVSQYDRPLRPAGRVAVRAAAAYLEQASAGPVDAVKLDVQGFEPDVLRGLSQILSRDRPFIWVEIGGGTKRELNELQEFLALVPFPCTPLYFETSGQVMRGTRLVEVADGAFRVGNYLLAPCGA